jgi:hypothetical protein
MGEGPSYQPKPNKPIPRGKKGSWGAEAMVVRRRGRPGRELAADPAVRDLQPAGRLVPVECPHHHGELGGQ